MGAPLSDAVVCHHKDLIGVLYRGEPMGDGDGSTVMRQGIQAFLDPAFALIVQSAGGFIQDQDRRIL